MERRVKQTCQAHKKWFLRGSLYPRKRTRPPPSFCLGPYKDDNCRNSLEGLARWCCRQQTKHRKSVFFCPSCDQVQTNLSFRLKQTHNGLVQLRFCELDLTEEEMGIEIYRQIMAAIQGGHEKKVEARRISVGGPKTCTMVKKEPQKDAEKTGELAYSSSCAFIDNSNIDADTAKASEDTKKEGILSWKFKEKPASIATLMFEPPSTPKKLAAASRRRLAIRERLFATGGLGQTRACMIL